MVITWTMASPATIAADTTGGTYQWTAPASITSVKAEAWGAGGGGGAGGTGGPGSGGGGGEYAAEPTLAVTAGNAYTFVVGNGGPGGTSGAGTAGTSSTMAGDSVTVTANGGGAGHLNSTSTAAGGTGSTNTTHHNGGAAGTATSGTGTAGGSAGGGSAGPSAAGNAGGAASGTTGGTGATAVTGGGPGGNAGSTHSTGSAPASGPGGGGGGGGLAASGSETGGAGFDGQLTLTWSTSINTSGGVSVPKPALAGSALKGSLASGSVRVKKPALKGSQSLRTSGGVQVKKPRLAGSGTKGSLASGGVRVKKPGLQGTEHETSGSTGSVNVMKPSISAFGSVQYAFPPGPLGLMFELLVGDTWTEITEFVMTRGQNVVTITRGRPDESGAGTTSPATMVLELNNRDGRFSSRNPLSPYYGLIGRNTQIRASAPTTSLPVWVRGYRFWGEVPEWPPSWDPTGTDVSVQISAAGILRRLNQSGALRGALFRYYAALMSPQAPLAYWPAEDGPSASSLASGVPGGFAMTFSGQPSLAADDGFAASGALPDFNGAILTGLTGVAGSLPVAQTVVFSAAGSGHWTAPPGITSAVVECWGGGAGGGSQNGSTGGGGGGGGEYASDSVSLTPGTSYAYTVGRGGSPGTAGGNSVFTGNSGKVVTAHGGSTDPGDGTGGAAGTGSSNATHFDGGSGADGSGGPGGSADTNQNSQKYKSAGTFTWTAPSDISSSVTAYVWGAGGGGGASSGGASHGGGGGGGGGFSTGTFSASPGSTHDVEVGAGGSGGTLTQNSQDGDPSSVNAEFTAHGGSRGLGNGNPGSGGTGNKHNGGTGGTATSENPGGGGGGGAALGGNGGDGASAFSGGTGGAGANAAGLDGGGGGGGQGGTSGSKGGQTGGAPGGGGGGGYANATGGGGDGNRGQVELFWFETGSAPDAAVGGGGGSSAGSASAGNNGDTELGGAAPVGGGPGGGQLAGSTFTASPVSAPGGGGAGYDSLGGPGTGATGMVRITYAPSGSGSPGVAANVMRFFLHLPDSSTTDGAVICQMETTGTIAIAQVVYNAGGFLTLNGLSAAGATLFSSGQVAFSADGAFLMVSVELTTSGSNVAWTLTALVCGDTVPVATSSGTLTSAQLGDPFQVVGNPNGTLTDTAWGQVVVQETLVTLTSLASPAGAYAGETAADRITRLCTEQGIPVTIIGDSSATELMGPQLPTKLVTLLQECEDADRGLIFEPRDSFGLAYRTRADLYNQDPAITLNYVNGDLASSLQPTEDDQLIRNDVTASRPSGSSSEQVLSSGPMSVQDPPAGVGPYPFPLSVNVFADGQLPDLASWVMFIGTVDQPRYPVINLDLIRTELVDNFDDVVAADLGDYLTVQNPPPWLPPGPINQLMLGYTEQLAQFTWTLALNAVPELPYEVAAVAAAPGDLPKADTDGSFLHNGIGTGDTSFSVDSPVPNMPWVDSAGYPDEFPFDVTLSGEQMTVTEIDGTSTPQTFTVTRGVNGITKPHDAGEAISLAHPAIVAL